MTDIDHSCKQVLKTVWVFVHKTDCKSIYTVIQMNQKPFIPIQKTFFVTDYTECRDISFSSKTKQKEENFTLICKLHATLIF